MATVLKQVSIKQKAAATVSLDCEGIIGFEYLYTPSACSYSEIGETKSLCTSNTFSALGDVGTRLGIAAWSTF